MGYRETRGSHGLSGDEGKPWALGERREAMSSRETRESHGL